MTILCYILKRCQRSTTTCVYERFCNLARRFCLALAVEIPPSFSFPLLTQQPSPYPSSSQTSTSLAQPGLAVLRPRKIRQISKATGGIPNRKETGLGGGGGGGVTSTECGRLKVRQAKVLKVGFERERALLTAEPD
jgi:hypothetical protein